MKTNYNYLESLKADIKNYIDNEFTINPEADIEGIAEELYEILWTEDSVTGNASGSYTFNRYQAEQNLSGNLHYISEMIQEGWISKEELCEKMEEEDYEYFDVSIRCFLLNQAIYETLEEMQEA